MTLRDGMHAIRHQYSTAQVQQIAGALDKAGVDSIEVAHGDGLQGSSFNYGFGAHSDIMDGGGGGGQPGEIACCCRASPLRSGGVSGRARVVRSPPCSEADVAAQHIAARELGMDTVGF